MFRNCFPIADPTWVFLSTLLIILFAPLLLEKWRVPSVVGMIVMGMIVGPGGLHLLERDGSFELFGRVGLFYIMFLAALEMNLLSVKSMRMRVVCFGLLSFLFPVGIGFLVHSLALDMLGGKGLLMAAMYGSHTLISYPIVMRMGLSRRNCVALAVGGTIVADTLVLVLLAFIGGMYTKPVRANVLAGLLASPSVFLVWMVVKVVFLSLVIVYVFPLMARRFFRRWQETGAQFVFVLALVFLGAGMMQWVGMEGILGAFLVGLALNPLTPNASSLKAHLEFVGEALFIPYFLIGVGMMIHVDTFLHLEVLSLAALMVAIALGGKYLAAWVAGKAFGMPRDEVGVLFGLSCSRAAATLAVAIVGHGIVVDVATGERLFGEDILGGTMIMILVTCIVSSFATSSSAKRMVLGTADTSSAPLPEHREEKMVLALSKPEEAEALLEFALSLRAPSSSQPLVAIHVALDSDDKQRAYGLDLLERLQKKAATGGVKLLTQSRYSVNIATGISHALKEADGTDLLLTLHKRVRLSENPLGRNTESVLDATTRQVLVYRAVQPLGNIERAHILALPASTYQSGFRQWADRLHQLHMQASCMLDFYGDRETLLAIDQYFRQAGYKERIAPHDYDTWDDLAPLAHKVKAEDMVVLVMARRGDISYNSALSHYPDQMERYFGARSLLLVYPTQQE